MRNYPAPNAAPLAIDVRVRKALELGPLTAVDLAQMLDTPYDAITNALDRLLCVREIVRSGWKPRPFRKPLRLYDLKPEDRIPTARRFT